MSALTDLFTSMANKIRSKTGGSTTYTPPQMVNAIDDVYQAGVNAGSTPTQTKTVTATTSSQTVTPDSGYALSSVTVNPQVHSAYSSPVTANGYKDLGSTHNVRYVDVNVPSPTVYSVTPSNSIPPDLERNKVYQPTSAGYAISDYDLLEPSNSTPRAISTGHMYAPEGSGYAIESYSNVTPSADGTYFSSGMKKMSSSGYAYSSQPSANMDFFDTLYAGTGQNTYTFTNNLKVAYVCTPTNSTSNRGTYTGSGSMTSAHTGTYQVINKITNVKSGDTFKAPAFAASGANRTLIFIVGQKE